MQIFPINWLEWVATWKDDREVENTRVAASSLYEE